MREQAIISDIQHFSLGDGPGIRTTVFFKGCNLHCPWCHNPETISPKPELLYFERLCISCGKCAALCGCHKITDSRHQFERSKCSSCGKCAHSCPSGALKFYGQAMTAEEIIEDILQDEDFYRQSSGGVTLSGGEPLLQADFCAHLAKMCKQNGIKVLLDTAGNVNYSQFEKVLPYIDCVYLDLKGADSEKMQALTGANMELILDNLRRLIRDNISATVRIPIIPQYNDDAASAAVSADLIREYGPAAVHLIPFHRLGGQKYAAMGKSYPYSCFEPLAKEKLEELRRIYLAAGLEAEIMQ